MSYHTTECIFDLIAASGPQSFHEIVTECRTQCAPAIEQRAAGAFAVDLELTALEKAGIVERDMGAYDLTDFGYNLMIDCGHSHAGLKT